MVAQNHKKVNTMTKPTFAGLLEEEPRPVMFKHECPSESPVVLMKLQVARSSPDCHSVGLRWCLRIYISNKLPGNAYAAELEPYFENHWIRFINRDLSPYGNLTNRMKYEKRKIRTLCLIQTEVTATTHNHVNI